MKKNYWWRVGLFGVDVGVLVSIWIYEKYFCFVQDINYCPLDEFRLNIFDPIFYFSLAVLVIIPFLFFTADKIFVVWLRFALVWVVLTIFLVGVSPESTHSFNPLTLINTKGYIVRPLATLFTLLSLGLLAFQSWRERSQNPAK